MRVEMVTDRGYKLLSSTKRFIMALLKVNMEHAFGNEWTMEEKVKRKDMVSPDAHYIFVRNMLQNRSETDFIGFLHYRFTSEEDVAVLYIYELQIQSHYQGKGIGSILIHVAEHIAKQNHMSAVLLTVQKTNVPAIKFYTNKHKFIISSTSPSRVDPTMDVNYEILCKILSEKAKFVFDSPL